ncbi:1-acyl-sn-glycerol-3-phosphate acyltransferase PLS1 [Diplonema papillatum]|nr:1-acyl-sn-glycerol-3-phosphate acyltransferase PLS1 [Diplonema papillatum]
MSLNNNRKTFASLNKYPAETPFWIGLFAEGTRQTPEKLAQSQQYCRENGKPVLKNVLWPRTRGFASTIEGLKGKVDAVYCFNMCCPDKERMPSFLGLLCAKPAVIQVSMRRYPVSDLPKTEEGLKEFCCRVHIEKDQLMEECFTKGRYPGVERTFPRHLAPRLSIWFWTILVQGGLAYLVLTLKSAWVVRSIVAVYVIFSLLVFVMINYAEAKTKKSSSKKSD